MNISDFKRILRVYTVRYSSYRTLSEDAKSYVLGKLPIPPPRKKKANFCMQMKVFYCSKSIVQWLDKILWLL